MSDDLVVERVDDDLDENPPAENEDDEIGEASPPSQGHFNRGKSHFYHGHVRQEFRYWIEMLYPIWNSKRRELQTAWI